jgi:hypothetical protein
MSPNFKIFIFIISIITSLTSSPSIISSIRSNVYYSLGIFVIPNTWLKNLFLFWLYVTIWSLFSKPHITPSIIIINKSTNGSREFNLLRSYSKYYDTQEHEWIRQEIARRRGTISWSQKPVF